MDRNKKIKVLQDIVKINSINGNEEEVAIYLRGLLNEYGIEADLVNYANGRANLVAEIGSGKNTIGFSGHMDVVDIGDESLWKYPPFEGHIDGNKLYGRGSTDMKSGLMAMVVALIELKEENAIKDGKLRLLATVGEEVGELGAEQLTTEGYADDLNALVIGEPTGYNLVYAHKGSINYSLKSIGKESHSSMPEAGINAINHINDFITVTNAEMENIAKKYKNEELGRTIHNVTVINGGNQVNTIPAKVILQGNIRSIPEFDNDRIIKVLEDIVENLNKKKDYNLELTIDFNKIPVQSDKNSKLINIIQDICKDRGLDELPVLGSPGTTDAAEFAKAKNKFDFVIFGPGVSNLAHKIDEYVEIDNYLDMVDIYKKIALKFLD